MSNLRLIGIIVGIGGLLWTFWYFRGQKWKRQIFFLSCLFNICLLSVSINPNLVNILADLFALKISQRGRLIALLILSNIFLWLILIQTRSIFFNQKRQFDLLHRKLAAKECENIQDLSERVKSVMILIPAFNEAENLEIFLKKIPDRILDREIGVLVIDDGSTDRTKQIVEQTGHLVVSNMINRGQGAASRLGYDILIDNGAKVIVTMDADNQHDPSEIHRLITPILDDKLDLVIGSRILGDSERTDAIRFWGVKLFSKLVSFLIGETITDCASGFKAFNADRIKEINLMEDQFQSGEVIVEAAKRGLRIGEVPITIGKREKGTSKKGSNISYGFNFLKMIISIWLR